MLYRNAGPWIIASSPPVLFADEIFLAPPGMHAVVIPGHSQDNPAFLLASDLELVSSVDLHAEARVGHPVKLSLAEAQAIFASYWSGSATMEGLAEEYHVSRLTVAKIVKRLTYWWL